MTTKSKHELFLKLTDAGNEKMTTFATQLSTDAAFRKKFLDNPAETLNSLGISMDNPIALDARQKAMIELFSDPKLSDLYNSGDINNLRVHIADRYRELLGSDIGTLAGSAVADFDVAIEVEAVAVAVVAVAAIAAGILNPSVRYREEEVRNGVLTARIAALEARIAVMDRLEAKVKLLEGRIP